MKILMIAVMVVAGCTPVGTSPWRIEEARRQAEQQNLQSQSRVNLDVLQVSVREDYRRLKDDRLRASAFCSLPGIDAARRNIDLLRDNRPTGASTYEVRMSFAARIDAGNALLRLAALTQDRRCGALARSMYLDVIETYQGENYTAIRQRAQVGLDELRASR